MSSESNELFAGVLSAMEQHSSPPGQIFRFAANARGKREATPRSTRGIDYQDVPRPVAALAAECSPGFVDPFHSHKRAQFLYASCGVTHVTTDAASFIVPPQRALWIPGGTPHEVQCRGHVSVRTLYIDPAARPELSRTCQVLEVSDLLRGLVLEATRLPLEYDVNGRDGRIMELILDEITAAPGIPLQVSMPRDPRLMRICRAILDDPAHTATLNDWARVASMGRRTFTRQFRRETSMSFAAWRQRVRLMRALARLASDESVTTVAHDVGYASASAFTAMFRKAFGAAPMRYRGTAGLAPRNASTCGK
jgi:AraC-like DNA-binding protein/quercetin dioxygenase-like cupin family protein